MKADQLIISSIRYFLHDDHCCSCNQSNPVTEINSRPEAFDDLPPLPLDASDKDKIMYKQKVYEKLKSEGIFEVVSGDETLGKEILINNKPIKLLGIFAEQYSKAEQTPTAPILAIRLPVD